LTGENVLPQGSGRTDAGVHALAQVATFATLSPIPVENFLKALNDALPTAIRVLLAEEVAPEFHARKSAQAKTYEYRMYRGAICPPFAGRYVWHYPFPLDEDAMAAAADVVAANTISHLLLPSIPRSAPTTKRPEKRVRTSAPFMPLHGCAEATNLSTQCGDRDFCTTWCAIWWGRFCWSERELPTVTICNKF